MSLGPAGDFSGRGRYVDGTSAWESAADGVIPYLPAMSSWGRRSCVQWLAEQKKWDGLTRETLIRLAGDATSAVRGVVYPVLAKAKLEPARNSGPGRLSLQEVE